MNRDYYQQAEAYFSEVWAKNGSNWESGSLEAADTSPTKITETPVCISVIARLIKQLVSPIPLIAKAREEIGIIAPSQYLYPLESVHISLQGLTTHSKPTNYNDAQIEKLTTATKNLLSDKQSVVFELKGINVIGNQVFIPVYPTNRVWEKWREALVDMSESMQEVPISYPNKAPIHMNIARIGDNSKRQEIAALWEFIQTHHNDLFGEFVVNCLEIAMTDFYVRAEYTKFLREIHLQST